MVDSTKVLCPIADIGHLCFRHRHVLWLLLRKSDDSNDVNKTRPSVKLLAVNILRYFVIKEVNDSLGSKSTAELETFVE